jgi:hypothetical protein
VVPATIPLVQRVLRQSQKPVPPFTPRNDTAPFYPAVSPPQSKHFLNMATHHIFSIDTAPSFHYLPYNIVEERS